MVSWQDVVVWCNAYSEMTGKEAVYYDSTGTTLLRDATDGTALNGATQQDRNGYRLPTEKEWEYAARGGVPSNDAGSAWTYKWAGTNTESELDKFMWYRKGVNPVREKKPNSAGLYDMSGNASEFCFDKADTDRCVARGGGNLYASDYLVGFRISFVLNNTSFIYGFRLVYSR
jgi:formylglycine-generating enzyme required for sulfatase activity